jgi:hypothetical protein
VSIASLWYVASHARFANQISEFSPLRQEMTRRTRNKIAHLRRYALRELPESRTGTMR